MCLLLRQEVYRLTFYLTSPPIAAWLKLFDTGSSGEGPEDSSWETKS